MALADKGVAFDTVLIDLFNKPEWYEEVATNNQTPAVRLDGEYLCESLTILLVRSCCHPFANTPSPHLPPTCMSLFAKTRPQCDQVMQRCPLSIDLATGAHAWVYHAWSLCIQALEEAFPESPLLPQDPQAAAAVKGFCNWCAHMHACLPEY